MCFFGPNFLIGVNCIKLFGTSKFQISHRIPRNPSPSFAQNKGRIRLRSSIDSQSCFYGYSVLARVGVNICSQYSLIEPVFTLQSVSEII